MWPIDHGIDSHCERITSAADAVVSVFDQGFLYGEGVCETIRTYGGRLFRYESHLRRLRNPARVTLPELPFSDDELEAQIPFTMAASVLDRSEVYVLVFVTRGVGEPTYDPQATPSHRSSSRHGPGGRGDCTPTPSGRGDTKAQA
jgi:branched-chain amino acid aminotransferase